MGPLGIEYPAWVDQALCAQTDPELFFPDRGGPTRTPKRICGRCPVAAECLDYAMDFEARDSGINTAHRHGIYGGLVPQERVQLHRLLHPDLADDTADTALPTEESA